MPRRSALFSLSALTRAYQRNLKTLARVTRPARAQATKAVKAAVKSAVKAAVKEAIHEAVPTAKTAHRQPTGAVARRKSLAPQGDWIAGVATGPAGARRFHLYVPPGLALRSAEKLPLMVMLHGCDQTGADLASSSRRRKMFFHHCRPPVQVWLSLRREASAIKRAR